MKKISIILPCYNEDKNIIGCCNVILRTLEEIHAQYELIFVDDGSTDQFLTIIKQLATDNPCVRYLTFSRNFGKEAAMYAGLQFARGDYVAVLDADLQDPPELLARMYGKPEEGWGGRRVDRAGEPIIRSFSRGGFTG